MTKLPNGSPSIPMLRFPRLYIIALVSLQSKDEKRPRPVRLKAPSQHLEPAMFHLESAPAEAFDAWIGDLAKAEKVDMSNDLNAVDRSTWTTIEKWWIINVLAERNIDMTKYLFESREAAARALKVMSEAKVEVGGKA